MARILFAWELGAGTGHLSPYQTLITELVGLGHEVFFASRDPAVGAEILKKSGAKMLAAPILLGQPPLYYDKPLNYAQILHNIGFNDAVALAGRVQAWVNLFQLVKPDLLVVDHGPTALLASQGSGIKRMALGSSFLVPPRTSPFPNMRDWLKIDLKKLAEREHWVLQTANKVLDEFACPRLNYLHELFDVEEARLTTFMEMDHYYPREPEIYIGIGPPGEGIEPDWPDLPGKRIFAYLKRTPFLKAALQGLQETGLPVLVRVAGLVDKDKKEFGPRLKFADQNVSIKALQTSASLLVSNGNHGVMAHSLLAGIPQLLLPDTLERVMVSRRVAQFGAAEIVSVGDKNIKDSVAMGVKKIFSGDRYEKAANRFATKYADYDLEKQDQVLLNLMIKLLA